MIHYCIYLDESGHSGRRFWDIHQPLYIEGGWAIESENVDEVRKAIEEIESRYASSSAELKGRQLVKHPRGRDLVLQIIRSIGQNGGVPILYIIEKKFFVCGKIVETLLDPAYNTAVSFSDLRDLQVRQRIANELFDNGGPLIQQFAEAYREKDRLAIALNAARWAEVLEKKGNRYLSGLFRNGCATVSESLEAEFSFSEEAELSNMDSMNVTSWFYVFQHLEQNVPGVCSIIHDHIHTFEAAYLSLFNLLKKARCDEIEFDDRKIVLPLKMIRTLTFEDSRSSPIIRAADMLVGSAQFYIKEALLGQTLSDDIHRLGILVLGLYLLWSAPSSLGPPPVLGTLIVSDGWFRSLIAILMKHRHLLA